MRKPDFGLCKNKGADQLCSAFVFAIRIVQSLFFLNFKLLAGRFVSDRVENPVDRFSRVAGHMRLVMSNLVFVAHLCITLKLAKVH